MFRSRLLLCVPPGPLRGLPLRCPNPGGWLRLGGPERSAKGGCFANTGHHHASFPRAEAVLLRRQALPRGFEPVKNAKRAAWARPGFAESLAKVGVEEEARPLK